VLMRTSNRGRHDFEELICQTSSMSGTKSGDAEGRRLYDAVGDKLSELAAAHLGKYGYGAFGAVAGADPKSGEEREETAALRRRLRNLFFLIPGYGAQGGAASDAALLLREGNGGVVNASRSILKAWQTSDPPSDIAEADNAYAAQAARRAVMEMRDALRSHS